MSAGKRPCSGSLDVSRLVQTPQRNSIALTGPRRRKCAGLSRRARQEHGLIPTSMSRVFADNSIAMKRQEPSGLCIERPRPRRRTQRPWRSRVCVTRSSRRSRAPATTARAASGRTAALAVVPAPRDRRGLQPRAVPGRQRRGTRAVCGGSGRLGPLHPARRRLRVPHRRCTGLRDRVVRGALHQQRRPYRHAAAGEERGATGTW